MRALGLGFQARHKGQKSPAATARTTTEADQRLTQFSASSGTLVARTKFKRPLIRSYARSALLKCGRCGCTMTAEKKKGRYVYYRCTGFKGACGNTYIREEQLASLLGSVIRPIQISPAVADDIAAALRSTESQGEERRIEALRAVEQRRRTVTSKLDRGYDDYLSGKISEEFWTRRSEEWDAELRAVDTERARLNQPKPYAMATAEKILELAKRANFFTKTKIRANSVDC